MTARRIPAVRKRARKPVEPTTPEFRSGAHVMLDKLLDDFPGTDAIAIIVDGRSGHEVASIPVSLAVKEGIFLCGYVKLFGEES